MSTAAKAGKVSVAVFGSRILGVVREAVFAHLFGTGVASDAFRVAFKIPNLLRDLFAEGALSTAFVTTFTKTLEKKGDKPAWHLANLIFTAQLFFLGVLVLLGIWFSPQIVFAIAPGLPLEAFRLAVPLTQIMFPFILLVSAAAIVMGLLNAKHHFFLPASASMFFNLGSIISGVAFAYWFDPKFGTQSIFGMALGVLIGGFLQFTIQIPTACKLGFRFRYAWDWKNEEFNEVLRLLVPAIIGASAVQINVLVNTAFASQVGPGAISWLEYAFRLMQFPIGLLGVAIATVTLPLVSRNVAANDHKAFRSNLAKSIRLAFVTTIPAAVGLAVLAEPLIRLIYERGKFLAGDTFATAQALKAYAIGLSGYAAIKVIAPAFYALGKPQIPLKVSFFGIILNLGLNILFIKLLGWGHVGLAFSTSLVALINFSQLYLAMLKKFQGFETKLLFIALFKTSLASAIMAGGVMIQQYFTKNFQTHFLNQLISVALSVVLGVGLFITVAYLLRLNEIKEILDTLQKRLKYRS